MGQEEMKIRLLIAALATILSPLALADQLSVGTITKINTSGPGMSFGIFVTGTAGLCPSTWLYVSKAWLDADGIKALMATSITAYTLQKSVAVYGASGDCGLSRFSAIDVLN